MLYRAKSEGEDHIAARNLGIVSRCALTYWKRLPPRTRSWYDVEDMIGDVALKVCKAARRYDPKVARESTWVHHVAENACRSILSKHLKPMRDDRATCELTPLLSARMEASSKLAERESVDAVMRTIAQAPEAAKELIALLLRGAVNASVKQVERCVEADRGVVDALLRAAWECDATAEDFRRVLACAV